MHCKFINVPKLFILLYKMLPAQTCGKAFKSAKRCIMHYANTDIYTRTSKQWKNCKVWKVRVWNQGWQLRNVCDGRLVAIFNNENSISGEFGYETWRKTHKFTCTVVIKKFAINLLSQPLIMLNFSSLPPLTSFSV